MSEIKQAVILAAGIGSRLRPMTSRIPKCLVKTAGKPILQYQLDAYKKAGVEKIILVVGYEGEAVKEYLKNNKDFEYIFVDNIDYETTNNMYSFYLASKFLDEGPFILNNADLAIDENIILGLVNNKNPDLVAVDKTLFNDESMKVTLNAEGYIVDISKKIAEKNSSGCSIDFYKFSKSSRDKIINHINHIIEVENNKKDWTEVALQQMFQNQSLKFKLHDIEGANWVEIDNYDDLALSDRKFSYFDEKINNIKNFIFDLDGTIYVGNEKIKNADVAIKKLKENGKNIFFLTNNSSKKKTDYIKKIKSMGIDCEISNVINSVDCTIEFLLRKGVKKVHILGTQALKEAFLCANFVIDSESPEFVVLGYDTELTYEKLVHACKYINQGVDIVATHPDDFCPSEFGPIPDIGALIELIFKTTGRKPIKVLGKPSDELAEEIRKRFNPDETIIVGDRLYTDLILSKKIKSYGLLVLSGETKREDLQDSEIQPDFILKDISFI